MSGKNIYIYIFISSFKGILLYKALLKKRHFAPQIFEILFYSTVT